MLSRYRVEDDPDWAAWRSVRAAEVLANLSSLHARLLATLKASEGGREKPLMTKNQMLIRLSQSENTKFGRRILLGNPFPKKSSPQFGRSNLRSTTADSLNTFSIVVRKPRLSSSKPSGQSGPRTPRVFASEP